MARCPIHTMPGNTSCTACNHCYNCFIREIAVKLEDLERQLKVLRHNINRLSQ